jgi:hypothetical protein
MREQGRPPLHDWAGILDQLRNAYGYAGCARLLGVPKRTIEEWHAGHVRDLKHSDAVRVLALLELVRRDGVSIRPTDPGAPHGQVPHRPNPRR